MEEPLLMEAITITITAHRHSNNNSSKIICILEAIIMVHSEEDLLEEDNSFKMAIAFYHYNLMVLSVVTIILF